MDDMRRMIAAQLASGSVNMRPNLSAADAMQMQQPGNNLSDVQRQMMQQSMGDQMPGGGGYSPSNSDPGGAPMSDEDMAMLQRMTLGGGIPGQYAGMPTGQAMPGIYDSLPQGRMMPQGLYDNLPPGRRIP